MTDMMVDIESTGTDPHTSAIIQISAVKFNYRTEEIGGAFDRCVSPLPFRGWDDDTREFWMGRNREVYQSLISRMESPIPVFTDFTRFALEGQPDGGYRFWSKPLSFDWPMVASHIRQLGGHMPFHYRLARDMNSFIAGLRGIPEHTPMEEVVPFNGVKHNGLHDCAYQIDCLFAAKRGNFQQIISV